MKTIPLTRGKVALVDDDDFEELNRFKWSAMRQPSGDYHAVRNIPGGGGSIIMARVIMGAPKGMDVDHHNHDTLDNRKENLRVVPRSFNMRNKRKCKSDTASKYKGVTWCKDKRRWRARIRSGRTLPNGQHSYVVLGYFRSEEPAARAYDSAARSAFGEFACLNFPEPGEQGALSA